MHRSLQMHITLTAGLSTVCNIDISPPTAPTIARAEVVPESPHHDNIALFCININICRTDSPQQLRRLIIPLEHSNDTSVPTSSVAAWLPTISIVDVQLKVPYCYKPSPTGTIAMGHSSALVLSAMEMSPLLR